MDNEQADNQEKCSGKKSRLDKILVLPGIHEAINLTRNYAWECAINEAIEQGNRGELGDKLKAILESNEEDSLDQFMKHRLVTGSISENLDELLEEFSLEASTKIAELWGFSQNTGELISRVIYSGMDWKNTKREELYTPITLLLSESDLENNQTFAERYHELEEQGITVCYSDHIPKGRIYFDVTELTNQHLRSIYKSIELCRKFLGIKHEDLRAGAPKSFDTSKALETYLLKRMGKSNKDIARQLGFEIYYAIPQGTFSHMYKYLKLGKQIDGRLRNLESYLSHLHPMTND